MAPASEVDALYQPFAAFEAWDHRPALAEVWDSAVASLLDARTSAGAEAFDELLARSMRQAAIDTGALEGLYTTDRGFTMTTAAMAGAWEAEVMQQKGADVARLVAAQVAGYELAIDAATRRAPLSEVWLRELHATICAPQDTYAVTTAVGPQHQPLPKGAYKTRPNHVLQADGTVHAYAPVPATGAEVHRLLRELRSERFAAAHPAVQAAYAHHGLVAVHPFADGNGRVARVLASVFLLRAASLPLVVFADQRAAYLVALRQADEGNRQAFVGFVLDRTVDVALATTQTLRLSPSPSEVLARFPTNDQSERDRRRLLDDAAQRLLHVAHDGARQLVDGLSLPPELTFESHLQGCDQPPKGWRIVTEGPPCAFMLFKAAWNQSVHAYAQVLISTDLRPFELAVRTLPFGDWIDVRVADVIPEVSSGLLARLEPFLERLTGAALQELATLVERETE